MSLGELTGKAKPTAADLNAFVGQQKFEELGAVLREDRRLGLATTGRQTNPTVVQAFVEQLRTLHQTMMDDTMPRGASSLQQNAVIAGLLNKLAVAEELSYEGTASANIVELTQNGQKPWQTPVAHDTGETAALGRSSDQLHSLLQSAQAREDESP